MENKGQENKSQTCIAIFPEELWGMILDWMVEESKDIQSVLVAFPELGCLLHGRKPDWFIEQAFPHIFKQLFRHNNIQPFLALRVVSKRWRNITEEFLKNDPSYHPYNRNGINRRNIPYGQFNCIEVPTPWPKLRGTEMIKRNGKAMLDHPRNPFFIGRLSISNQHLQIPHVQFLEASLEFLQKFGHYISHFEFTVGITVNRQFRVADAERLFEKILECISCTPNVRFLKINLLFDDYNISQIIQNVFLFEYAIQFPELPQLETLIVDDLEDNDNVCLPNAFSDANWITRLKRLEVPMDTRILYENTPFPNLCELTVKINAEDVLLDFDVLDVLNKDDYPLLRKLSFTSVGQVHVSINKLFSLLARLEIEEMQLLGECIVASIQYSNLTPIPSIKYFRVRDGKRHDFEFLKMFTSLEYLYLDHSDRDEPTAKKIGRYCRQDRGFSSQLRMYMNAVVLPKDVNIWEALPTVKFIGVEMRDMLWQYSRECGNKRFRIKLMD